MVFLSQAKGKRPNVFNMFEVNSGPSVCAHLSFFPFSILLATRLVTCQRKMNSSIIP